MDEKVFCELLNQIRMSSPKIETTYTVIEKCNQAMDWAHQSERWDLVIECAEVLSPYYLYNYNTHPSLVEELSQEYALKKLRDFWQQGESILSKGLIAAQKIKDRDNEIQFLRDLTRLASLLEDFDMALDSMKQLVDLVNSDQRESVAYELLRLGQQAGRSRQFSTSNMFFEMSLKMFQDFGDKSATADTLFFLGRNEMDQGNTKTAKQYFKSAIRIGTQSNHTRVTIYSLFELGNILLQEGKIEQARSTFEEAVMLINNIEMPTGNDHNSLPFGSIYDKLQDALANLNS